MKKTDRLKVWNKYRQRCSYCGRHLLYNEMQVDHLIPQRDSHTPSKHVSEARIKYFQDLRKKIEGLDNMMPSCRHCNHYKRSHCLEDFRQLIRTLDRRVKAHYINKVAIDYGIISEVVPWDGKFYFEKYKEGVSMTNNVLSDQVIA